MLRFICRAALLATVVVLAGCHPGAPTQPDDYAEKACDHDPESVTAAATAEQTQFRVSCNVALTGNETVTKRLIFEGDAGSGVTFDCNGAAIDITANQFVENDTDMIEIRSVRRSDDGGNVTWERPRDITLRNCNITGAVRIYGMGKNTNRDNVRDLSRTADFVREVRANAPTRITLDRLLIVGLGRTPLYLSTGVSYVTLVESTVTGSATSVGVYLDSESYNNTFRNNRFSVTSRDWNGLRRREEIAVDGSSYNKFINNRFSTLEGGGIFLYRNCGEHGTIRHTEPAYNQIINNVFYYDRYTGGQPAIFFGARSWSPYCEDDAGYPWGSSADNRNYARYNAVYQNQIYKRSLDEMIVTRSGDMTGWDPTSAPNFVDLNETVEAAVARRAGCFSGNGYKRFVLDGESIDVIRTPSGPVCGSYRYTCNDGEFSRERSTGCSLSQPTFECSGTTNDGCEAEARCAAGEVIVEAAAACNLEFGRVPADALSSVRPGTIEILKESDNRSDGRCFLGSTTANAESEPEILADDILDNGTVDFGCSERDRSNDGECHVRAKLWCR